MLDTIFQSYRCSALIVLQRFGNVQHVLLFRGWSQRVTPPVSFHTLGNITVNLQIYPQGIF